jgi:hypothetical protein
MRTTVYLDIVGLHRQSMDDLPPDNMVEDDHDVIDKKWGASK